MKSLSILHNMFGSTNTVNLGGNNVDLGALGAIAGFLLLVTLIAVAFTVVVYWRIFAKAGKPGWAAIVPFYQTWVLFDVLGWKPWLSLIYLLSYGLTYVSSSLSMVWLVGVLVVSVLIALRLAKKFGKGLAFAIFGLLLFPYVGYAMLAFGKAQYKK